MASSRLAELTGIISRETSKIDAFFAQHNLPPLSFDPSAPADFPVPRSNAEIQAARRAVVNATKELQDLMVGPRESLRWMSWNVGPTGSKIRSAVPRGQNDSLPHLVHQQPEPGRYLRVQGCGGRAG
jgi:hypothetical protein